MKGRTKIHPERAFFFVKDKPLLFFFILFEGIVDVIWFPPFLV
jgi:hypothetical protein